MRGVLERFVGTRSVRPIPGAERPRTGRGFLGYNRKRSIVRALPQQLTSGGGKPDGAREAQ